MLLSHLHTDHLHLPSLRRLGQTVPLLVPRGAGGLLRRQGFRRVVELAPGDMTNVGELTIGAVAALHDGRRYPVGAGRIAANGYTVTGSRSLYFAGDTDYFEAMNEFAGGGIILSVSGWGAKVGPGHLDPTRAAEALRLLEPRLAIPIHWGTYAPLHWRLSRHQPPLEDPLEPSPPLLPALRPTSKCASSNLASAQRS